MSWLSGGHQHQPLPVKRLAGSSFGEGSPLRRMPPRSCETMQKSQSAANGTRPIYLSKGILAYPHSNRSESRAKSGRLLVVALAECAVRPECYVAYTTELGLALPVASRKRPFHPTTSDHAPQRRLPGSDLARMLEDFSGASLPAARSSLMLLPHVAHKVLEITSAECVGCIRSACTWNNARMGVATRCLHP